MKLLFVHEGEKLKEDNEGSYYTGGNYNQKVWNRYLTICSNLSAIMRKDSKRYDSDYAKKKFNVFNKEIINFIEIPDLTRSLISYLNLNNRRKRRNAIAEAVSTHDMLIARLPSDCGNLAVDLAKSLNKPYLIEVVGCPWDSLWNHSFKGKLLAYSKYIEMRKKVKNAPYVIYVTNKFLQNRYPTNGKSTNCSNVTLEAFDEQVLKNRLDKIERYIDGTKLIIGTTAAVDVRYKGQQYIIKALGELNRKGITNFEYQLMGGGDQSYLKSIAEKYNITNQVKFLGSMPHSEVFKWLDTIDIYVQPSRQEGLPRALIEAMSRGVPAFGAKTAGIPELLENGCLFSNTRNNIREICSILQSFSREAMTSQAIRNFNESKNYHSGIIEERRNKFFMDFINSEMSNKVYVLKKIK
jgi:glycosyltransferase involved in cell wall biosynthesis